VVVSIVLGAPGVAAQAQTQNGSDAPSPPEVDTEIQFEDEVRVGEETTIRPVATVDETPISAEVSVDLTMSIDGEEAETQSFEVRISNDTVIRRGFTHTFESPGTKQVGFRGVLSAQGQQVSGTISDEVEVLAEEDVEDTDRDRRTDGGGSGSETRGDEAPGGSDNQEADNGNGSEEVGSDDRKEGEETETEGDAEAPEDGTDETETETGTGSEEETEDEEPTENSQEPQEEHGTETEGDEAEATEGLSPSEEDDEETEEDSETSEEESDGETVGGSTEADDPGADQRERLPGFTAAVALVALFAGALYARYV